jgi:hypothetical protein
VQVFAVIAAAWTDRDTGIARPGRRAIAKAVGCKDRNTITLAIDELVAAGAMEREHRFVNGRNDGKSQLTNSYRLVKPSDPPLGGKNHLGGNIPLGGKNPLGEKTHLPRGKKPPRVGGNFHPQRSELSTQNQVQNDLCFVPTDQVVPTKEQPRQKTGAATPEVSEDPETEDAEPDSVWDPIPPGSPGWFAPRDPASFNAQLATMPIPGRFASPGYARRKGYEIFDAAPDTELFDHHVDRLMSVLQGEGVATSEDQCRLTMADVYTERQMRDRTWDRTADHERRRARR